MPTDGAAEGGELAGRGEALARLRRFGGERLVHDMAALALDGMAERVDAARRAAAADDFAALAAAAHALRSSCAQFGAAEAARLAGAVEASAAGGDRRASAVLVGPMAAACDAYRSWLRDELARRVAAGETP